MSTPATGGSCRSIALTFLASLCLFSTAQADLLVSDRIAGSVVRYNEATGKAVGNFVSPGSGGLSGPIGMRFGPDGNLYVASSDTNQILRYNGASGAFIDVFAAGVTLKGPSDLRFSADGSKLFVANFGDQTTFDLGTTVAEFDGHTGASLGTFAPQPGDPVGLVGPDYVRLDSAGNAFVSNFGLNTVEKFDSTGAFVKTFIGPGTLDSPAGQVVSPDGSTLYVASLGNSKIQTYNATTGAFIETFFADSPFPADPVLNFPSDLMFDRDGNLLVASLASGAVLRFDVDSKSLLGTATEAGTLFQPAQMLLLTPGDANGDGKVTGADYTIWAANFNTGTGKTPSQGDFTGDGKVTGADYTIWAANFTPVGGGVPSNTVPEPATWALLLTGAAVVGWSSRARLRSRQR